MTLSDSKELEPERSSLRRWQVEALESWKVGRRGVASVVTGGGKTTFALACARLMLELEPAVRVLVVVPTTALRDQWVVEMAAHLGLERTAIGTVASSLKRGGPPAVVLVVNTARTAVKTNLGNDPWMLIADECHRYGAPANRTAIMGEWYASLGLSATPVREYDDWFEEFVAPEIGHVFYEYGYAEALADGILSPFQLKNYRVPLTKSEESEVGRLNRSIARASSRAEGPESDGSVERLLRARAAVVQRARARIPATVTIMDGHRGERCIVFHESIAAADTIASLLREEGHRVATYHSRMGVVARLRELDLFRAGQLDVLVTCRALDEGLDVPGATFGLIVASTASTRQRIQRLGRVLRKAPGKSAAVVATIYAGTTERSRLEREEEGLAGAAQVRWYEVAFG